MIDLATAAERGPLPACDHLDEPVVWHWPVTWCGCGDLLRCHRCYPEHVAAVHATVPACQGHYDDGRPCGYVFGPESIDRKGRHRIDWSHFFETVWVSFPSVGGVVLDFHDATIEETRVVCLACAALHQSEFGNAEF
jgi:hypothetical protein